jgi:hypothetical protein
VPSDCYSKSSLVAIHQGIRRYLQELPYNRDIDIVTDMKLKKAKANDALSKIYAKKCRQGGKGVQHKISITTQRLLSAFTFISKSEASNSLMFSRPLLQK